MNHGDGEPPEPWWDAEDDEWSEEMYYVTLADHLRRKYDELTSSLDCD